MGRSRLELQALLETLTTNVYFQPPTNLVMVYPCIVYERDDDSTLHADNRLYSRTLRYSVTYISRDPDDVVPGQLAELPYSAFNRAFVADNLHHDVFQLYF